MPNRPPISCNYPGCAGGIAVRGTSYCEKHQKKDKEVEREADKARWQSSPWRHLYQNKAWRMLRIFILNRDPLCKICGREGSYVADHIRDHKGDPKLFYDPENLQGVCKPCHDKKTGETRGNNDPGAPTAIGGGGNGPMFVSSINPDAIDKALEETENLDDVRIP